MQALPDSVCYLNGDYTPLAEAKISVLDRGFIFGDGIYEVVPVYGRRFFRFAQHMARLDRSLASVRIVNPLDEAGWLERARRLVAAYPADDQMLYIQVSRGVAPRDHAMPRDVVPTVFMMTNAMKPPSAALLAQGAACVGARDFRWERADIKSTSLLGNVLARQISADVGAVETLLFRDGLLTEASSSNVWVVQGGTLFGVPKSAHVLEGIRYDLIRELCEAEGIPHDLRPIAEAEVRAADELLLSSASKEIMPVTQLDGRPIGGGAPGPLFARLHAAYQRAKNDQSI